MDFQENFLQLVWKYQYFDQKQLQTTDGQAIEVKKIGYHNFHEGPDFLEAQIKISGVNFHGHVEVHRESSDWKQHTHDVDERYNSVILHVVWENDEKVKRSDGTHIPTFELKGKVLLDVVRNYEKLLNSREPLLCGPFLEEVPGIQRFSMLEKSLVERFEEKGKMVHQILAATHGDWEETAYRWLFYCFGFKTNSQAMLRLAESLPYKILKKHASQPMVQEAILFGQAAFIPETPPDDYAVFAKREYGIYQKKYGLLPALDVKEWKFMRVRPANYPTIRLSQLLSFLSQSPHLFSDLLEKTFDFSTFKSTLSFDPMPYWQRHYQYGKERKQVQKGHLTEGAKSLIAINFLVPLWFAYGQYQGDGHWQERCFDLLQEIPSEQNHIIRHFDQVSWRAINAYDSQGMIGLYNNYCKLKKCLNCKVGQSLLKPA